MAKNMDEWGCFLGFVVMALAISILSGHFGYSSPSCSADILKVRFPAILTTKVVTTNLKLWINGAVFLGFVVMALAISIHTLLGRTTLRQRDVNAECPAAAVLVILIVQRLLSLAGFCPC